MTVLHCAVGLYTAEAIGLVKYTLLFLFQMHTRRHVHTRAPQTMPRLKTILHGHTHSWLTVTTGG